MKRLALLSAMACAACHAQAIASYASNTPASPGMGNPELVALPSGDVVLARMVADPVRRSRWGVLIARFTDHGSHAEIVPIRDTALFPYGRLSIAQFNDTLVFGQQWRDNIAPTTVLECQRYLWPSVDTWHDVGGGDGCPELVATPYGVFSVGFTIRPVVDASGANLPSPGLPSPAISPEFVPGYQSHRNHSGQHFLRQFGGVPPITWHVQTFDPTGLFLNSISGQTQGDASLELMDDGRLKALETSDPAVGIETLRKLDLMGNLQFTQTFPIAHVGPICSAMQGTVTLASVNHGPFYLHWLGDDGSIRVLDAVARSFACHHDRLFVIRSVLGQRQLVGYSSGWQQTWIQNLPESSEVDNPRTLTVDHNVVVASTVFTEPGSVDRKLRIQRFSLDGLLRSDAVLSIPEFPIHVGSFE